MREIEEDAFVSACGCGMSFVMFLFLVVICLILGSCKTQYITDYQVEHDTLWVLTLQQDSIFKHDSIYIREYMKGDTVHVDKEKWSVFYRDRVKHDSIYIHKTDTIQTVKVEKVEKHLSALEQVKMHVGGICLWALFFLLGFQLWRWYKGK